MLMWSRVEQTIGAIVAAGRGAAGGGGGGGGVGPGGGPTGIWGTGAWNFGVAVGFTAMAGIALAATVFVSSRGGNVKSPWSRLKRKRPLSLHQWNNLFTPDGKLKDKVKFLKKVRSGGVDPGIRPAVWPFLLGVYDLNSSEDERNEIRARNRNEYKGLRVRCHQLLKPTNDSDKEMKDVGSKRNEGRPDGLESTISEDEFTVKHSLTIEGGHSDDSHKPLLDNGINSSSCMLDEDRSGITHVNASAVGIESCEGEHSNDSHKPLLDVASNYSSCTLEEGNDGTTPVDASEVGKESSEGRHSDDSDKPLLGVPIDSSSCIVEEGSSDITNADLPVVDKKFSGSELSVEETDSSQLSASEETEPQPAGSSQKRFNQEDFSSWQRIIRLDAIRANGEWIPYSPSQTAVSEDKARQFAEEVRLKDYNDLEPCRIYHAARLVAVLDAYALYDPETGYCQGMSDLLSPILAVMEEDHEAFWCFVGFMSKARHNFRLDEAGIKRQLGIISKIIKSRDPRLYRHLEKLEAEGCFFVYRMVLVLFRRELTFEQTLWLWEVMWADQAAFRAGVGKSVWGRLRMRVPPTEDLLLYAVAAAVLQKHKVIIEKYTTMYEIMRELHSMAGQIDVWKLLDDAHDLVGKLHTRV